MVEGFGPRRGSGEGYSKLYNDMEANPNGFAKNNWHRKRGLVIRILLFGMALTLLRFVYVIVEDGACGDESYCIIHAAQDLNPFREPRRAFKSYEYLQLQPNKTVNPELQMLWTTKEWRQKVDDFSVFFQKLMEEGFLRSESKALCVGAKGGQEVLALKEIGVSDAVGIDLVPSPPLVAMADLRSRQPFGDNTFDFEFTDVFDLSDVFASEIQRTLKPGGFAVVRTMYSTDSLILLFNSCSVVRSAKMDGYAVFKKNVNMSTFNGGRCAVSEWKTALIAQAEPLIQEEPLKPWITLKRNIKNIKYLPSLAFIGSRRSYVYVDVGARSYGSSIGGWFKKKYPTQNNSFSVFAIEADEAFHGDYAKRKGTKLLPFAAWVRNETLIFEINRDAGSSPKTKGMGRIQPVGGGRLNRGADKSVVSVQGFDFAEWLKNTVTRDDFVVMKMDVEGTEFDLLPRMIETGAICLIDELFLECHYNRWQRSSPTRTPKYHRTYGECLDLFNSLRMNGVLVHQWW